MPEGRVSGRGAAMSIDAAEHGDMLSLPDGQASGTFSSKNDPKPPDRELRRV